MLGVNSEPHEEKKKSSHMRHAKTCFRAYADSEGPDQPAHSRCLIRTFTVREQNHWTLQNVSMESKCPDDTLRMREINLNVLFAAHLRALVFSLDATHIILRLSESGASLYDHIVDKILQSPDQGLCFKSISSTISG